ncbi:hypothetical protein [Paramagnetospirillum magneticum]|nr:hypothetical protein [Paramagnetospirillum magneticum]
MTTTQIGRVSAEGSDPLVCLATEYIAVAAIIDNTPGNLPDHLGRRIGEILELARATQAETVAGIAAKLRIHLNDSLTPGGTWPTDGAVDELLVGALRDAGRLSGTSFGMSPAELAGTMGPSIQQEVPMPYIVKAPHIFSPAVGIPPYQSQRDDSHRSPAEVFMQARRPRDTIPFHLDATAMQIGEVNQDAELLSRWDAAWAAEDEANATTSDDPAFDKAMERWAEAWQMVAKLPAKTPAGLAIKVRAMADDLRNGPTAYHEDLIRTTLEALSLIE